MMEVDRQILDRVLELGKKTNFERPQKFKGALTVELVRKHLIKEGLNISARNVFIEQVSNELDILVLRKGAKAVENLVYRPQDVIAVLEIKFRGFYSEKALKNTRSVFDEITKLNPKIKCVYVTISECKNYKYRATPDNLGYNTFELFLSPTTNLENAHRKNRLESTGDWRRLLSLLSSEH